MRNKESSEPPRKRSRTSEDADDVAVTAGGKKARGRPRVDTQDATAADVSVVNSNRSHSVAQSDRPSTGAARNIETDALTSVEERRFVSLNARTDNEKRPRSPHSSKRAPNSRLSSKK